MSVPTPVPYIQVAKASATRRLPVQLIAQRDRGWRPVAVSRTPKIGLPPPVTIATPEGSAARRNYDVDEWVWADWTGGMGEETYAPATSPSSYMYGTCDSRWPRALVLRPLATQLGGALTGYGANGARVVELGYPGGLLVAYLPGAAVAQYWDGGAWGGLSQGGAPLTFRDHALGLNGTWAVGQGTPAGYAVMRSGDGLQWERMGLAGVAGDPKLVAVFDDRVWLLTAGPGPQAGAVILRVYSSADLQAVAAGAGTWVAGNTLTVPGRESPERLFVWQYPPDRGRPTLWLATRSRLWYYDYYADTPTWVEWFALRSPLERDDQNVSRVSVAVSARTGNLYVGAFGKEWLWEFTGAQINRPSWNKRHGMPAGSRLSPLWLVGDESGLYAWCAPHPADPASPGALLFMDDGGQFHHLWAPASQAVRGGGVGNGTLWSVSGAGAAGNPGAVWAQGNPDILSVPPQVAGREFAAEQGTIRSAWINAGMLNVNKRVLQVELDCVRADGSPGLEAGAMVDVSIATRTRVYHLGTLTSGAVFPAVLPYPGGIPCKEWQVWLTLTRGTAATATPIVRAVKVGYRPRPKQRWTYTCRIDLRDYVPSYDGTWVPNPAFAGPDGRYFGQTASALRLWVDELADNEDSGQDDALVALSYGGHGNPTHPRRRNVAQAEVLVTAQESPDQADGLYLLSFSDLSAATSG